MEIRPVREGPSAPTYDVSTTHVASAVPLPPARGATTPTRRLTGIVVGVLLPALATVVLIVLRRPIGLIDDILLLLLVTVVVARLGGLAPALVSAVVGSTLLNYFFTPPLHTLKIADADNTLALVVFVLVAVLVSSVVDRAARRTREAMRSSAEAHALAALVTTSFDADDALERVLERLRATFGLAEVSLLEATGDDWREVGRAAAPVAGEAVSTVVEAGAGRRLRLLGRRLETADQRTLGAFAAQVTTLVERARLQAAAAETTALAEADRMRTALLAAVGHDLRTPLAAAKASVSGLLSDDVDLADDDRRELLVAADESLDRLTGLVANLLDMSRLRAGAMPLRLQSSALEDVVARAVADLGPRAHPVLIDLDAALPGVLVDPGLIERVVVNLVDNALRYSPPDRPPTIRAVRSDEPGAGVELLVVDHGPGISVADRDAAFVAFQRLGDTDNTTGVGLGLALARGLTEAMGGRLAAGETPGGGLTMVVSLPAARAGPAEPGYRERDTATGQHP